MAATGELIRMMNYVDDIAAILRRVNTSLPTMSEEEKIRLAEYIRKSDPSLESVLKQLDKQLDKVTQVVPEAGPKRRTVPKIQTVAVIGAGIMGRGIAHAAALGGCRTILEDLLPNALRKAESEIRANLDKAVELGKVNAADADAAFSRIEYAGSVDEAARQADLVIEAVPEEMESKIEIFTLLDKVCRPTTILASNTSSLSVTEIASVTYRAKKCVGMHFFNPVHKMKLLEVVRALETDDETLAAAVDLGKRMGKEVVVVKEVARLHHQPHQCHDRQ